MNEDQRNQLRAIEAELAAAGRPLAPTITRCLMLAESLGEREYAVYFNLQLLGLRRGESREGRWPRRAVVLLEEGCEEFTNIAGLTQIRFRRGAIREHFAEIRRTLEREGLLAANEQELVAQ